MLCLNSSKQEVWVPNFCINVQLMQSVAPNPDVTADRCTKTHVIDHYMHDDAFGRKWCLSTQYYIGLRFTVLRVRVLDLSIRVFSNFGHVWCN